MQIARFVLVAMLGLGLAVVVGCGDDDPADADGAVDEGASHEGDLMSEACQAIMDVCHDVDTGEGEIGACHELAHEDEDSECMAESERCIALCEAAGGGEHDEDAGHDES
jgi:hypothetical protein